LFFFYFSFVSDEGELFHRINQIGKPKVYCISLAEKRYHYTRAQIFFLSLEAFEHFESSPDDFVIEDHLNFNSPLHFSEEDLIMCYNQLHSLFNSTTEILSTLQNRSTFRLLQIF
jgi:hypothetical protein